jgi:hypothetical protein
MSEPTTTMRDALEAAFEKADEPLQLASSSDAPPAPDLDASSEPVAASSSEPAADPAATQDLNALSEDKPVDNELVQQPERDEQGKFKKTEGVQAGPKSGPRQQGEKAPASWRPDVREHWGTLPDPVRAEIQRRETEVARTLQETAEARKTAEAVMKTIEPYQAFIKAENSNPLQAIDNLMSTAARLRTGTAPELAQLVAGIVNQFGTGRFGNGFIEMLDSALAGQTPRQDPQQVAIEQVLNQRLAPMQSMLTQFQQAQLQQQQQASQAAQTEVSTFLERAEFGNDVREDMADIIEAAQRRGQNMSLQDAYKKACLMNDNVRSVLSQRAKARGAQQTTTAAQRARSAAVQVSGSAPMGALRQESTDVRSAIEAAITMTSR